MEAHSIFPLDSQYKVLCLNLRIKSKLLVGH